jgi:hypothetical protein
MKKKMNSNQNGAVLVKFNLVHWFVISLNYTTDWLQTFNFVQFCPCRTLMLALDFNAFFILVLGLWFMQFDPQSTIKLLILFNFTPNFNQLGPQGSTPFAKKFLAVNFFNLAFNWPQTSNFLWFYPWFQPIDFIKIKFGLLKFQFSQLSPNWAIKLKFSPIKLLIKLIWPI